jgi:pyruvate dehydrogenase (quinone)
MACTVGDFMIARLAEWGVSRVYGYPGDGINGILGAIDRARDRIRFIQARHEEMSAFMACAHAKFTGQIGVCLPGAIDPEGDERVVQGTRDIGRTWTEDFGTVGIVCWADV